MTTKPLNPKDVVGSTTKVALSYVPLPVIYEVALGMMEGGFKYGRHNYRIVGVRASVYVDATFRHISAFWEGEDFDPDSKAKLHHVSKAIASLTVLRDSMIQGNWVDDRPPKSPSGWLQQLNAEVPKLVEQYPDPVRPYTQVDFSWGGKPMPELITWTDRVVALKERLGRMPKLDELLEEAKKHTMTPEERKAQQESFVRGMMPTGDPNFD